MKRLNDLEYLKLNRLQLIWYNIQLFICSIPLFFKKLGIKIWNGFLKCGSFLTGQVKDIAYTFSKGNWAVKLSFLIFGFGNLYYGQILRGLLFLLFEVVFVVYMLLPDAGGLYWISKAHFFQVGNTVGDKQQVIIPEGGDPIKVTIMGQEMIIRPDLVIPGDDSTRVLFYALLSVIFIIAFVYTWRLQVKQCRINMDIRAKHGKINKAKDDLKSLLDEQFHKTLLALPILGIAVFTVIPIIYMILIAFTNYGDYQGELYNGIAKLFQWVGFEHFKNLTNFSNNGMGKYFGDVLIWTLTWAFFATFTNYFLGMIVAMLINKKGIKFKKVWRTILVATIAVPQFVSLLYVRTLFNRSGVIGSFLFEHNLLPSFLTENNITTLWGHEITAKILLIVINIWIGIPYVMLMASGILMNIPADLYESSRVDGANSFQQFMKITLPYMLFVTGPYLLTSFVGNLNNFNVIYLLSGGGPDYTTAGGAALGHTDLLVTWLYSMTLGSANTQYYTASLIGIMVFLVVAVLSLIVYNIIPSTKNEEDYA